MSVQEAHDPHRVLLPLILSVAPAIGIIIVSVLLVGAGNAARPRSAQFFCDSVVDLGPDVTALIRS